MEGLPLTSAQGNLPVPLLLSEHDSPAIPLRVLFKISEPMEGLEPTTC